jgi:hypothetical protein
VSAGFETIVVGPAIRGIDPQAVEQALAKMDSVGARVIGQNGEDWEAFLRDNTK